MSCHFIVSKIFLPNLDSTRKYTARFSSRSLEKLTDVITCPGFQCILLISTWPVIVLEVRTNFLDVVSFYCCVGNVILRAWVSTHYTRTRFSSRGPDKISMLGHYILRLTLISKKINLELPEIRTNLPLLLGRLDAMKIFLPI